MSIKNIERLYNVAYNSIFTINGKLPYPRVVDCLIRLANEITDTETDETLWFSIGEFDEAGLDGLIIGGYWHFTEWHGGQASKSYAAMCALGQIYSPGMEAGPEEDTREHCAYIMLEDMAKEHYA